MNKITNALSKWSETSKILKANYIKRAAFILIIFLIVLYLSVITETKINPPEEPNIILLIVDAWRADSLGCYNKNSTLTPNIDEFAKNAVLFKNAVAQSPNTMNSAPSIFCSVYPSDHGYINYRWRLPTRFKSMAELLKKKGYQTFGISTNPHVSSRQGLARGFDIFIEETRWRDTNCDEVNSKFIKWLDNKRYKKFFAMLWYIDPHNPYDPPIEYTEKYIGKGEERKHVSGRAKLKTMVDTSDFTPTEKSVSKKLYMGEVNFFDTEFHKLISYLKQRGLMKNSIIILTSDHGESFWERKDFLGQAINGHGTSLYEEQIKIPLIILLPNQKNGKIILEKVQHIDILPTILDYVKSDFKIADDSSFKGQSLRGLINGEKFKSKYIFSQLISKGDQQQLSFYMECIQTDNFKLVNTYQYKHLRFAPPYPQLFNLSFEESECDLTDEHLKFVFASMKKRLSSFEWNLGKVTLSSKKHEREIKQENKRLIERLKSLGYIKGNAHTSTLQSKFGGGAGLFKGDGGRLEIADNEGLTFGSGNFTVDFWVRFASTSRTQVLVGYPYYSPNKAWQIAWEEESNSLKFSYSTDGSNNTDARFPWSPSLDTWYHIAILRNGSDLMAFVDGSQIGHKHHMGLISIYDSKNTFYIGSRGNEEHFNGWLDEIRISKGIARWTSNFTPPSTEYTSDPYTSLLFHMNQEIWANDVYVIKGFGKLP